MARMMARTDRIYITARAKRPSPTASDRVRVSGHDDENASFVTRAGLEEWAARLPHWVLEGPAPAKTREQVAEIYLWLAETLMRGDALAYRRVASAYDAIFASRSEVMLARVALVRAIADDSTLPQVRGLAAAHEVDANGVTVLEEVRALMASGKIKAPMAAAIVSLETGAFGDEQRANEPPAKARRRVRDLFNDALAWAESQGGEAGSPRDGSSDRAQSPRRDKRQATRKNRPAT